MKRGSGFADGGSASESVELELEADLECVL